MNRFNSTCICCLYMLQTYITHHLKHQSPNRSTWQLFLRFQTASTTTDNFLYCKAIFSIMSKSIYHFLMSSLTHWGDMSNLITLSFINISMPQMLGNLSQYSANLQLRHVQWTFLPEISHMNSTSPAGVKSHKEYNNFQQKTTSPRKSSVYNSSLTRLLHD